MSELCPNCGQAAAPNARACTRCRAPLHASGSGIPGAGGGWQELDLAGGASIPAPSGVGASAAGIVGHSSSAFSPLDDPLAAHANSPSLDLASVAPPARRQSLARTGKPRSPGPSSHPPAGGGSARPSPADGLVAPPPPQPRELSQAERRSQRMAEINGYGAPPRTFFHNVPYFVRVFLRRRVVADELTQLSMLRQRADAELDDRLCRIGEALYVRRSDPSLTVLAQHIGIVAQADSDVDVRQAKSDDARKEATRMLEDVHRRLVAAEQAGEPLRNKKRHLEEQATAVQGQVAAAQEQLRRHDYEVQKLRAKKAPTPDDLVSQQGLEARRVQLHGELQSTQLLLHPIQDELRKVDARLAKHDQAVTHLEAEQAQLETMMDREQQRHARRAGDARSELQAALRSLARAAIAKGAVQHVHKAVQGLAKLEEDAHRKRAREALHREALGNFDEQAYRLGMITLVGGTSALFLILLLQIFIL